jgi:hypothetical protein
MRRAKSANTIGNAMHVTAATVEPRLLGIHTDHPAAQSAIGELKTDLRDVSWVEVHEKVVPARGTKGYISDILIATGTPAGIAGLARIFHLWLSRDKRRSLSLTRRSGNSEIVIKIEGENVSVETVNQAVRAIWDEQKGDAPS